MRELIPNLKFPHQTLSDGLSDFFIGCFGLVLRHDLEQPIYNTISQYNYWSKHGAVFLFEKGTLF